MTVHIDCRSLGTENPQTGRGARYLIQMVGRRRIITVGSMSRGCCALDVRLTSDAKVSEEGSLDGDLSHFRPW